MTNIIPIFTTEIENEEFYYEKTLFGNEIDRTAITPINTIQNDNEQFYYEKVLLGNGSHHYQFGSDFSRENFQNKGSELTGKDLEVTIDVRDAILTIVIFTDNFPQDTGYILSSIDGTGTITQKNAGFLSNKGSIYEETVLVKNGQQYNLTVTDNYGDGLKDPGFFGAYFGPDATIEEEIARVDTFIGKSKSIVFVAERPETAAPTSTPVPTLSPAPTHSPTGCLSSESDAASIVDTERNFNPHFRTSASIFGTDHCGKHNDYVSCTNERLQYCQWHFLGTSKKKGFCRVDPITTCISEGSCHCETIDFRGGADNMADGIIFHAPMTLTARDIVNDHEIEYYETVEKNDNVFFISRIDFSHRVKHYDFVNGNLYLQSVGTYTAAFKLHYLYWDTTMNGKIWDGLGLKISVEADSMTINGALYKISMKKWTCNSIIITSTHLYVGRKSISRNLAQEISPKFETKLEIGPFTGDIFDVRLYQGTLSWREIREFGARCTTPDDPAALEYKRDIANPYFTFGCEPDFERLPVDEGGPIPSKGGQTYGSGPFATLWLRPRKNPFNESELLDVPEDKFDKEQFFQQSKIQSYLWERFLFDLDMIGYIQQPYSFIESQDQVPKFSSSFWNNPCRWLHNINNGWQYPIYGETLPKWIFDVHGNDEGATFDLNFMYQNRATWAGEKLTYVAHELFHGVQLNLSTMYAAGASRWLLESTAEFAADFTFPATDKLLAPFTIAPAYPIGMFEARDAERGAHFLSSELSISKSVQTLHMYGSWILWWFIAEQVGLPYLVGVMFTSWFQTSAYTAGEIFLLRELIENANLDFGDIWSTCIAHMRTWDFPEFGDFYKITELNSFEQLIKNSELSNTITLEGRKTAVEIDASSGTNGQWISGPSELRPGPNGWNCLTIRRVSSRKIITIQIEWDQGMGFGDIIQPESLRQQQAGCDEDPRFYNSVVVAHDESRRIRRYWKLKGKKPSMLTISTEASDSLTIHIILVPTPPADYVLGIIRKKDGSDGRVSPIPTYGYKYNVEISEQATSTLNTPEAEMENGLMKFAPATPGWWPVKCTCLEDPDAPNNRCVRPTFDGVEIRPLPDSGFCFAGDMMVYVKDIGPVYMKDLKIGDMVNVANNMYSKVYSFGHKDKYTEVEYILLHSNSLQQPLKVSRQHMVFVIDKLQQQKNAIPASLIRTGDNLILSSGKYATVTEISTGLGVGAFAPFTSTGVIAVNGILASNYVSLQENSAFFLIGNWKTSITMQWLSHTFQTPHRLVCQVAWSYCRKESYSTDSISNWVSYQNILFKWLLLPSLWLILALLTPFIIGLALFLSVMEQVFLRAHWVLPLLVALHFTKKKEQIEYGRNMKSR